MSQVCIPNKYLVELGTNTIVHITILFLILGLFFRFYVSKIVKSALESELEHLIHENISGSLHKNLTTEQQEKLNIIATSEGIEKINKYYDRPDKTVQNHNNWLFRDMFTITGILFALSILIILTSYMLCNKINVGHMLLENVLIFIGIGLVEFGFFTLVATKYVPAPPSLMVTSILESLDKSLKV